ncbi:MAG TPA: hypothetical protein VEZ20_14365 [Allosphingosinicella sp.]|nr:hypothetical protein [Allosphingosinicella sp.]
MPHLSKPSGLVSPRNFEFLLAAAALFEFAHLVGLFERRAEVDGTALALLFTIGGPLLVLLLGLGVTRLGSSVAKWLLVALVAMALFSAVRIGAEPWANNPALIAGAIAGLCQLAAVLMLFTPPARSWTGRPQASRAAPAAD